MASDGRGDGVPDNHFLTLPAMSNFMPVCNLQCARGPRHPRLSPHKKITVELKFRHAHTLCSSEITHPARLESLANPRRCGIRPRHLDARRGTTPSFPGERNDFETMRDRWIIQKSGFQSADHERNPKCLLPPASITRRGTTLSLLTRRERCSELEEPVDYLNCVFSASYRGGHLFRWIQRGVPAENLISPRVHPRPRVVRAVPVPAPHAHR
jgi:hypothetical protein